MAETINMHTNEQAKELWCPMARVAQSGNVDIPVAYNRSLTKELRPMRSVKADPDTFQLGDEPEETTVLVMNAVSSPSMAANCLGSRCAMWRWGDANKEFGFCGIGGIPLYFATQPAKGERDA